MMLHLLEQQWHWIVCDCSSYLEEPRLLHFKECQCFLQLFSSNSHSAFSKSRDAIYRFQLRGRGQCCFIVIKPSFRGILYRSCQWWFENNTAKHWHLLPGKLWLSKLQSEGREGAALTHGGYVLNHKDNPVPHFVGFHPKLMRTK